MVKGYIRFIYYGIYREFVRSQVDFSHYSDKPVKTAVDLVNTFDTLTGDEQLATAEDVTRFFDDHVADDWDHPGWVASDSDLVEIRGMRASLRQVFWAADADAAVAAVNRILDAVGATPRVSLHGTGAHLHFEPLYGSPARWIGAVAAMGLAVAIVEGGFDRLGVCASGSCDHVFVDTSRNRSRRHCSDTCTTRENVAAYRARRRAEG